MLEIEKFISSFAKKFDNYLLSLIPKKCYSTKLDKAMRYSIKVGGKRLRPIFLMEISKIFNISEERALRAAAAIELIHCYSLVHDDLPSMDDDDLRRGHQTCHKKFDEATAVLVGDAFQSLAFEILSDKKTHPSPIVRCSLINELSRASGHMGMVGGQMLDLEAEKKNLSFDEILLLQKLKTGELFRFACIAGPILSQNVKLDNFTSFADNLGLAFQIKDDLLDIEGDEKEIGKKVKKDLSRGKETLISFYGKEKAKTKSKELINNSIKILDSYGKKAKKVVELTTFVISRKK